MRSTGAGPATNVFCGEAEVDAQRQVVDDAIAVIDKSCQVNQAIE